MRTAAGKRSKKKRKNFKELFINRQWRILWTQHDFHGEGPVPVVIPRVIEEMSSVYMKAYEMVTGQQIPTDRTDKESLRIAALTSLDLQ